jgi:hypothetical protein
VHADYRTVKATAPLVEGMRLSNSVVPQGLCIPCSEGKMTKLPFPEEGRRATKRGELIHCDLQGPAPTPSRQGNLHTVLFVDDFSNFSWVYFVPSRSRFDEALTHFIRDSGIDPKSATLRADNAPEIEAAATELGFKPELTCPHTPEQNGKAERHLATLRNDVIVMLISSGLPMDFWQDAAIHAVRVRNRLPKPGHDATRFELWHHTRPNVSHLRTFGCHAVVLEPKDTRAHRLAPRGKSVAHVGFAPNHKGYLFVDPDTYTEVVSRHARFDEGRAAGHLFADDIEREIDDIQDDTFLPDDNGVDVGSPRRRSKRTRQKPSEFWHVNYVAETTQTTPRNYRQAMASPDAESWQAAIQREINQMEELGVWTIVPASQVSSKPIPTKWSFRRKILPDGSIQYKARLCACGNFQQRDSYGDTYAPASPQGVTRIFAALSVWMSADHYHIDIQGAYLHAPIKEDVFLFPPQGVHAPNNSFCKLQRSMYGTHQANRNWVEYHREHLMSAGYRNLASETCVFTRIEGDHYLLSEVHTDDADVLTNHPDMLRHYIDTLSSFAQVGSVERMQHFCGISVCHTSTSVTLHQDEFLEEKLTEHQLMDVRKRRTPAESLHLTAAPRDEDVLDAKGIQRFQSIVGSLQWLSCNTRPDISFATHQLSKYNHRPTRDHLRAAHHVLMYLRHNRRGITYSKSPDLGLHALCDSDWGSDPDDRKPRLGWVVFIQGGPVIWRVLKADAVAQSTCEAEYMAAAYCAMDVHYIRQLLEELDIGITFSGPTDVFVDNRAALRVATNTGNSPKLRHVALKFHLIKDLVKKRVINLRWIDSASNTSDIFTKPLSPLPFSNHASSLTTELGDAP